MLAEQLQHPVRAAVMWDGAARGEKDTTRGFFAGSAAKRLFGLICPDVMRAERRI
jgi:hypothetical protein